MDPNQITIPHTYHSTVLKFIKSYTDATSFTVSIDNDYNGVMYPHIGSYVCKYENEEYNVQYNEEGQPLSAGGEPTYYMRLIISHKGNNLDKLKNFVTTAILSVQETDLQGKKIRLFTSSSRGFFCNFGTAYAQDLDHIFVPPKTKSDIKHHIDAFLASKEKYIKYGRLYKAAFLLTGVPGSGKTSLVKAFALEYKRPIYVLNFTKEMSDQSFIDLMTELKSDSILLIEDIDAFFVDRQPQNINISFSAFINFLDGTLGRGDGVITFITANNPDRLDHALIRPGRIDKIVKFEAPKKREINMAFNDMVTNPTPEKFTQFYEQIKHTSINMSGIIDHLFRHPDDCVETVEQLLEQAKFVHEIVNEKTEKMFA